MNGVSAKQETTFLENFRKNENQRLIEIVVAV